MPNVLITARYFAVDPEPVKLLKRNGCVVLHPDIDWTLGDANVSQPRAIELLQDAEGAIISSMPITDAVLSETPRLKVIALRGVGYDSVDVAAATARGIAVAVAPGFTDSVADYLFGLLLAVARQVTLADRLVRERRWEVLVSTNIAGKTMGIIGLGRIGKAVARRAHGFDMPVLAADVVRDEAFAARYGVQYVPLETLLRQSDVVSVNAPLQGDTRHLIDAEALASMKPTAYLINTARGDLVDEAALAAALRAGRLAGAGLDVFHDEPLRDSPLRGLDNVVLSPHLAAYSREGLRETGLLAARAVLDVLGGGAPAAGQWINPGAAG